MKKSINGDRKHKPQPDHCDRILSDGPGIRCCRNAIAYYWEKHDLYFCNKCAHEIARLNLKRPGFKDELDFCKVIPNSGESKPGKRPKPTATRSK